LSQGEGRSQAADTAADDRDLDHVEQSATKRHKRHKNDFSLIHSLAFHLLSVCFHFVPFVPFCG
jgi:hypothetical protein